MDFKTLPKMIKALDAFTAKDEARGCLQSIHVLSTFKKGDIDYIRLCACDGHGLAIVDIEKGYIDYACKNLLLVEKVSDKQEVAYVTPKKVNIDCFPYPQVMNIIHKNLIPRTTNSDAAFDLSNMARAIKLKECFQSSNSDYFCPNYQPENEKYIDGKYYIIENLMIILMPLHTQYTINKSGIDVLPVSECLPGLLPDYTPIVVEEKTESPESVTA